MTSSLAILGLGVAIGGACIAFAQLRIAQTKLKLDFFERRYKVYNDSANFISRVLTDEIDSKMIQEYWWKVQDAEFVLNQQIAGYLNELRERANALHANMSEYRAMHDEDKRRDFSEKIEEKQAWFREQPAKLKEKFLPLIGFEQMKWSRWFTP